MRVLFILCFVIAIVTIGCGNKVDPSPLFPISYNSINDRDFENDKEKASKKKSIKKD